MASGRVLDIMKSPNYDYETDAFEKPASANIIYGKGPKTNKKRPGSAKLKVPKGSSNPKQAAVQKQDEWNYLLSFTVHDLASSIVELKKEYRTLEYMHNSLRIEHQKAENEMLKQQRRIDKLVSPHLNNQTVLEIRRDIEKSVLIRQLKSQIHILRESVVEKDAEISNLVKSQKESHLVEMAAEKEEYFLEIQRLKALLQAKESATKGKNNAANIEGDLRKEIDQLASGYQNLLTRITKGQKEKENEDSLKKAAPVKRAAGATNANKKGHTAAVVEKTEGLLGRPAQPLTALHSSMPSESPPDEQQRSRGGAQQSSPIGSTSRELDPMDVFGEDGALGPIERALDSGLEVNLDGQDAIWDMAGGGEVEIAMQPAVSVEPGVTHDFATGTKVEGLYSGGDKWYRATVKKLNPDGSYYLLYDDGDEEAAVPSERVRGNADNRKPMAKSQPRQEASKSVAGTTVAKQPISSASASTRVQKPARDFDSYLDGLSDTDDEESRKAALAPLPTAPQGNKNKSLLKGADPGTTPYGDDNFESDDVLDARLSI
jgi:hypothetical protein